MNSIGFIVVTYIGQHIFVPLIIAFILAYLFLSVVLKLEKKTKVPCLLSLQFKHLTPFIFVTLSLISLQFVIDNLFESNLMGKRFNLSGLVIILSLVFWGQIWGVIGMFLCVPLLMILSNSPIWYNGQLSHA